MTSMTFQILTVLLIMVMLCGNAFIRSLAANPASPTTNASLKSTVQPADLLWSSAQEALKNAQYKGAREKFVQFMRQYRNDKQYQEALFYQGLCEMKMGQETQAKALWGLNSARMLFLTIDDAWRELLALAAVPAALAWA